MTLPASSGGPKECLGSTEDMPPWFLAPSQRARYASRPSPRRSLCCLQLRCWQRHACCCGCVLFPCMQSQRGPRTFRPHDSHMARLHCNMQVYLTTLEMMKSHVSKLTSALELPDSVQAGTSNFVAGAVASMITQTVVVPIDVVSQKQMMGGAYDAADRAAASTTGASTSAPAAASPAAGSQNKINAAEASRRGIPVRMARKPQPAAPSTSSGSSGSIGAAGSSTGKGAAASATQTAASTSSSSSTASSMSRRGGLQVAQQIIRQEGIRGLYKGFGLSIMTYVPSSAMWWGAYGMYQKLIWQVMTPSPGTADSSAQTAGGSVAAAAASGSSTPPPDAPVHTTGEVIAVQTVSAVLSGLTTSVVTNPLDLVKTRVQVAKRYEGRPVSAREVLRHLLAEEGATGLLKGVLPRMANSALWGTCMVSAYEFLKRLCQIPAS